MRINNKRSLLYVRTYVRTASRRIHVLCDYPCQQEGNLCRLFRLVVVRKRSCRMNFPSFDCRCSFWPNATPSINPTMMRLTITGATPAANVDETRKQQIYTPMIRIRWLTGKNSEATVSTQWDSPLPTRISVWCRRCWCACGSKPAAFPHFFPKSTVLIRSLRYGLRVARTGYSVCIGRWIFLYCFFRLFFLTQWVASSAFVFVVPPFAERNNGGFNRSVLTAAAVDHYAVRTRCGGAGSGPA